MDERRTLPAVDRLAGLIAQNGEIHSRAVAVARDVLAAARAAIAEGHAAPGIDTLVEDGRRRLEHDPGSLREVVNASGVILQTNLGRAPLSERALRAMERAGRGYSNLEYDLEEGRRGSRHEHVRDLLQQATGAEDGIALNNTAAALFMVLQVFASGHEVVVSRGQAVEIGGGFRIPDVLRQSRARLVEVGTTNRTYARDYEQAVTGDTAALLRVHASNFRVVGFAHEASIAEMAEVARQHDVMLIDDLGSGCLLPTERFGMTHEPTVQESVAAGADLALFSGDKLLGGPQAGLVVGKREYIERLRAHPLARALRVDKTTIAALNATLQAYVDGSAVEELPLWRMVSAPLERLRERATVWAAAAGEHGDVVASTTMVGGGSLPGQGVPTWCATVSNGDSEGLHERLRRASPAIVGRVEQGRLVLDPRTVDERWDGHVRGVVEAILSGNAGVTEV